MFRQDLIYILLDIPVDKEDAPYHMCLRIKQPALGLALLLPVVVMDTECVCVCVREKGREFPGIVSDY